MAPSAVAAQSSIVSEADVEKEIARLFGDPNQTGLIIRVQGEDKSDGGRSEAFRELLASLEMYEYRAQAAEIRVEPPDVETITKALSVLGLPRIKRQLFERILMTFGKRIADPLGKILETTPGGALRDRMFDLRDDLLRWVADLRLTHETQGMLAGDLRRLLTDDYLTMMAEHEEKEQRPRVAELAQELLHLIGAIFERAFRQWPVHARSIAESVAGRMGASLSLRESPIVIRDRIIEGILEYLWIETSTDLTGAVHQLFAQPRYAGLTSGPPEIERDTYRKFAEACWDIVSENC